MCVAVQTFAEDELDAIDTMLAELDGSHPRVSIMCVVAFGHKGEVTHCEGYSCAGWCELSAVG